MILASRPKAERDPSQQRRAPRRDPGGGVIPMKPRYEISHVYRLEGAFPVQGYPILGTA